MWALFSLRAYIISAFLACFNRQSNLHIFMDESHVFKWVRLFYIIHKELETLRNYHLTYSLFDYFQMSATVIRT